MGDQGKLAEGLLPDKQEKASRRPQDDLKLIVKISEIMSCFSTTDRALSVSEISRQTGMPRSTAQRVMASLRGIGLLDQEHSRDRYRLGLKLFELGNIALANLDVHREARPIVDALRHITGHAVHLAVFDGRYAVVIQRAEVTAAAAGTAMIESAPAYCTSVGKAALAFQDDDVVERVIARGLNRFTSHTITDPQRLRADLRLTRERGYSIDDQEHVPGIRCIGAPIRNEDGRVFASLSVSAPSRALPPEAVPEMAQIVTVHADKLSEQLGYHG